MTDLKITVDQLKNYLGTGLEIDLNGFKSPITSLSENGYIRASLPRFPFTQTVPIDECKLICYRLSDLDKEIEHKGERFVPLNELFQMAYENVYYSRFDGVFDTNPILGQNLAAKAKEFVGGKWWDYGFTVELPYHFLMTVNGANMTIPNFTMYEKLFEWHLWPFGEEYFEHGLIIDKHEKSNN